VAQTYRFGEFELDLDAQQLRKGGTAVRLERRPFDLLVMLVERRGSLVSRDEIVASLWPKNVIIDFDSGLNTLVRKIRSVLGDSPDTPRYIETVSGRGYRFVAQVEESSASSPTAQAATGSRRRSWRIAVLALAVVAVGAIAVWRAGDPEPEQIRIAILPFENLTGDEQLAYLASGIAEDTNTSLAQVDLPNLRVIGVVSSRAAAGSQLPLNRIGEELGANYLVLSSLRLDQSRIRVTSRLVRVADGEQIWSASFDRELTNVLGLQRELSVAIAEQIRQRLSPSVAAAIDARQTSNPEAYQLYLKGRNEWNQFQPDSIPRALEYYQQAVDRDPRYALAWAGMAHAMITSTVTVEAARKAVLPSSLDALQNALEYGPDLAETQLALGSFQFFIDRNFEAAEAAARRAVTLDPNSAMCQMFLGIVLARLEQFVEARARLRRARELDPLFPLMFANSAVVALMANESEEARELATQAIAINPEFWVGYLHLGTALQRLGDLEGSIEAYGNAEKYSGNNTARATSGRAWALATLGRTDEARAVLDELLSRPADRAVRPYYIAVVYAALGEVDEAFEWLERGRNENNVLCLEFDARRELSNLLSDLRFAGLMSRCENAETETPIE